MIKVGKCYKNHWGKSYFGELISKINQGDLVPLLEKSGSGKSTLLNLLGLIDGDYSGHYEIFGQQKIRQFC